MSDLNEPAKSLPSRRSVLTTTVGLAATMTLADAAPAVGILADVHDNRRGPHAMGTITTKDGAEIYYKDWGTGRVVTFSHGKTTEIKASHVSSSRMRERLPVS
jgi:non-heme chloroperoxidase